VGQIECVCGRRYWPRQAWAHESCASNKVASNANASNTERKARSVSVAVVGEIERSEVGGVSDAGGGGEQRVDVPRKQRWSREAYNAYQREYMRKRRAK
jgi:hypothetical protein